MLTKQIADLNINADLNNNGADPMKKQENLRSMIEGRIADLQKQIKNFDPVLYVTYSSYENWIDNNYKTVTVGGLAFKPSQVLKQCLTGLEFHQEFTQWANKLDKKDLTEYQQMCDDLDQNIAWLEELR